jgi:hypothetical protein
MAKSGLGLEGRKTLVVGAGSGIGEETALLLGRTSSPQISTSGEHSR